MPMVWGIEDPAERDDEEKASAAFRVVKSADPNGPEPHDEPSRARVLIVDNDQLVLNGLLRQFRRLAGSVEVKTTTSPNKALVLAAVEKPDLMLVDLSMPELSGEDLIRHIRAARELDSMRLVAFTGLGDEKTRAGAIQAGAESCLVKPISESDLSQLVSSLRRRPVSEEPLPSGWRALFDALPSGLILADEAGRVFFKNATARALFPEATLPESLLKAARQGTRTHTLPDYEAIRFWPSLGGNERAYFAVEVRQELVRLDDAVGLLREWGASEREVEVFRLKRSGSKNEAIATGLGISVNTVRKHIQSLISQVGEVHSWEELEAKLWRARNRPKS